jgi:hypothetical protein
MGRERAVTVIDPLVLEDDEHLSLSLQVRGTDRGQARPSFMRVYVLYLACPAPDWTHLQAHSSLHRKGWQLLHLLHGSIKANTGQ